MEPFLHGNSRRERAGLGAVVVSLDVVRRCSWLCLALAPVSCSDDGAPVVPASQNDAGVDAALEDATPGNGTSGDAAASRTSASTSTDVQVVDAGASSTFGGSTTGSASTSLELDSTSASDSESTETSSTTGDTLDASATTAIDTEVDAAASSDGADASDGSAEPEPALVACSGLDPTVASTKAIAVGPSFTCIAVASGEVCCWGNNDSGQLGNGTHTSSVTGSRVVGLDDVVELSAAGTWTCGLTSAGEVYCWGDISSYYGIGFGVTPERVDLEDVVSLSSGADNTCALTGGGQVYCWGGNYFGILGNEELPDGKEPVLIEELSGIDAISVSNYAACALRGNGTVACWGFNVYGQLGDIAEYDPNYYYYFVTATSPLDVAGVSDVVALTSNGEAFCVQESDGSVWCWGILPDATFEAKPTAPTKLTDLGEVTSLTGIYAGMCVTRPDQTLACWGYNGQGGLGDGTLVSSSTPVAVAGLTGVVGVVGSSVGSHVCALRANGSVACWGDNGQGQLGTGEVGLSNSSVPLKVAGDVEFVGLSLGNNHSCGMTATGEVWCWGANHNGEVGSGFARPLEPTPHLLPNIDDAVGLAAGNSLTCALHEEGEVSCLGFNDDGQVGNGTTESPVAPTKVLNLHNAVQVKTGAYNNACAVLDDGGVACWGFNGYGLLALDPESEDFVEFSSVPVAVEGVADAVQVSLSKINACALTRAGIVQCWGLHFIDGDVPQVFGEFPTVIEGLEGVTALSGGWGLTCALKSDKTVACWGRAYSGELGSKPPLDSFVPASIEGLTDAVQIGVGYDHVCARRENGTVVCWGSTDYGALGTGEPPAYRDFDEESEVRSIPSEVVGLSDVTNLAVGDGHSCATVASGETYCWGRNWSGMLGSGETTFSAVPVDVVWQ